MTAPTADRHLPLPESPPELTTVGTDEAVLHDAGQVRRRAGLQPDTDYEWEGFAFRTLPEPGERLATFATVNDVHLGEVEAGIIGGTDIGPTFRTEPGDDPYPEVMNRGAVAEIAALGPDAVLVKGDLTSTGTPAEYRQFLDLYEPAFGDRLLVVRGNHDAYYGHDFADEPLQRVDLPGATLVLVDTSVKARPNGSLTGDQLERLDAIGAEADRPVLVFGHHHCWNPDSAERPEGYFGIVPDASERLVDVFARRPMLRGYFAGHTHRNRVRRFSATGDVPFVEVASVKEYPGVWAEYRVHEGGILQILRRIASPEALVWTEKTRHMYEGTYRDYAFGQLTDRCFVIPPAP